MRCLECDVIEVHNNRKYCSKLCYRKVMSRRNSENNAALNKSKSTDLTLKFKDICATAAKFYNENEKFTIYSTAKKYNLSLGLFRKYLLDNGLIDKRRQTKIFKAKLNEQFSEVNKILTEGSFSNRTGKDIANELGISTDYVTSYLRKIGKPLTQKSFSSHEIILRKFLISEDIAFKANDREMLDGLELDIYIPKYKVGIEVNGVYWHQIPETKRRDKLKLKMCKERKIKLLIFTDREITNDIEYVKTKIKDNFRWHDYYK